MRKKREDENVLVVVLADHGLDRLCAGHGRAGAHHGRTSTEGERSNLPDGVEESGADAVLGHDLVKCGDVLLL